MSELSSSVRSISWKGGGSTTLPRAEEGVDMLSVLVVMARASKMSRRRVGLFFIYIMLINFQRSSHLLQPVGYFLTLTNCYICLINSLLFHKQLINISSFSLEHSSSSLPLSLLLLLLPLLSFFMLGIYKNSIAGVGDICTNRGNAIYSIFK